ncbi:MAG TPA: hypothetical protein VM531_11015 [Sphingomicrobium sp.]|jgi:hypothetical protein|nr:hypothetical protein [Sphingomicrobium sp.]
MLKYLKYLPLLMKAAEIVASVEVLMGSGNGPTKLAEAKKLLIAAWAVTEGVVGKDLANDAAVAALAETLIEMAVKLMNMQPDIDKVAGLFRALRPLQIGGTL